MIYRLKTLILGFAKQYAGVAFLSLFLAIAMANSPVSLADTCSGLSGEFGDLLGCSEEFTSFQNFQGGLEAPSTAGYDPSLTEATDTREYVVNIANFALGFLGLIAVLIIIYSGFLYVTSAADSDGVESAKSNIKNSVIGIFIILGSFAFVNTILTAPGGGGAGGAGGNLAQSQNTNAAQLANYNSSAAQIQEMSKQLVAAYTVALDDMRVINRFAGLKPTSYTSRADFADYLGSVKSALYGLYSKRGPLSSTGLMARAIADGVIDPAYLSISNVIQEEKQNLLETTVGESGVENFLEDIADGFGDLFGGATSDTSALKNYICSLPPEERPVNKAISDCEESTTKLSTSNLGGEISARLTTRLTDNLHKAVIADITTVITSIKREMEGIIISTQGYSDLTSDLATVYIALKNEEAQATKLQCPADLLDEDGNVNTDVVETLEGVGTFCKELVKLVAVNSCESDEEMTECILEGMILAAPFAVAGGAAASANMILKGWGDAILTGLLITGAGAGAGAAGDLNDGGVDFNVNFEENMSVASASAIKNYLTKFNEIHTKLKNVKFTIPVITASVTSGTAPLIVTFDGSASIDPANRSLEASNLLWDLDGDGFSEARRSEDGPVRVNVSEDIECKPRSEEFIFSTCTFKEPGSYRVGLKLNSNTSVTGIDTTADSDGNVFAQNQFLPGIAYTTIRVLPQQTKIQLKAKVGDGTSPTTIHLRKFDDDADNNGTPDDRLGDLEIDIEELFVTTAEARAGIELDASQSTSDSSIVKYTWRFSDEIGARSGNASGDDVNGQQVESGDVITKTFDRQGVTNGILEVQDGQGNIDRKIFKVIVANHVPRIQTSAVNGLVMDEFVLDASQSSSSMGLFSSFVWNIDNRDIIENENRPDFDFDLGTDSETIKLQFKSPGTKEITLKATPQGATEPVETTISVNVSPREPVAQVSAVFPSPENDPGRVDFSSEGSLSGDEALLGDEFAPDAANALSFSWKVVNAVEGKQFVSGTVDNNNQFTANADIDGSSTFEGENLNLRFLEPGRYTVLLEAKQPFVADGQELFVAKVAQKVVTIDNVIDVRFADTFSPVAILAANADEESASVSVDVELESFNADKAQIFFGDGRSEVVDFEAGAAAGDAKVATTTHVYETAGNFTMKVRAFKGSSFKEITQQVTISPAGAPLAVITLTDRFGNSFINPTVGQFKELIRGERVKVSGDRSLNANGTTGGLRFSYETGDGRNFTRSNFDLSYQDLPLNGNTFDLVLTVTDESDLTLQDSQTAVIVVESFEPTIDSINLSRLTGTTPFTVVANAVGAVDLDGRIEEFQFTLQETGAPTAEYVISSRQPRVSMIIPTKGNTGAQVDWQVSVKAIDNEFNESADVQAADLIEATNGENEMPIAKFNVDRTSVTVGEEVTFFSAALDADGEITSVQYDLNANGSFIDDGFGNAGPNSTDPAVPFVFSFDKKSPASGFRISQMVVDDNGSRAVSRPLTIFVDSVLEAPKAAFETDVDSLQVTITDQSTLDFAGGADKQTASYKWDSNVNVDSDGDGVSDNDVDSTDINPVFDYETTGKFRIKLTLEDHEGNVDTVINSVSLEGVLDEPTAAFLFDADGLVVNINNKSQVDTANGGTVRSYSWDFDITKDSDGDGIKDNDVDSDVEDPVITYETKGTKKVKLTIVDSEGQKDSVIQTIRIEGKLNLPTAAFLFEVDGLDVEFENNSNIDTANGGTIQSIAYDLDTSVDSNGDGIKDNDPDSIVPDFTHTYDQKGVFKVQMTIVDSEGNTDSIERNITVGSDILPPVAAFGLSLNDKTITFDNTSRPGSTGGAAITDYSWDFDLGIDSDNDGLNDNDVDSTDQNPRPHTYDSEGRKTVRLTVKDDLGNTDSIEQSVVILEQDSRAPTAAFVPSINELAVSFANNSTADSASNVRLDQFIWDFDTSVDSDGDGITDNDVDSNQRTPRHSYDTEGTFEIQLTVIDSAGKKDSVQKRVAVQAKQTGDPVAAFRAETDQLNVQFKNNSRSDSANNVRLTEFVWDFDTSFDSDGDGVRNNDIDSEAKDPSFVYDSAGSFDVALTVTDSTGKRDSITSTVRVTELQTAAPTAAFVPTIENLEVEFANNSSSDTSNGVSLKEFIWDFDTTVDSNGDGVSDNDEDSNEKEPDFTYSVAGRYSVKLTVVDSFGKQDSITRRIEVAAKQTSAPVAAFVPEIDELKVKFKNNSTVDTDNGVTAETYIWDFNTAIDSNGDGRANNDVDSSEKEPTFTYKIGGRYTISLTVIDSAGKQSSISRTVDLKTKETLAPIAAFKVATDQLAVEFANNSRGDSANNVTLKSFAWDFDLSDDFDGDGVANNDVQSTEKNPRFVYDKAGTYRVGLVVTDSQDKVDTVNQTVTVSKKVTVAPTAAFTYSNSGLVVNFRNTSRSDTENQATITSFQYDFNTLVDSDGDGTKNNDFDSESRNPTFEYPAAGVYQVRLIVTDSYGKTDLVDNTIRVEGNILEQGASEAEAAKVAQIKSAAQAAEERAAALEAQLAALQAERDIVDDPAQAALPEGVSAEQREAQRQSQIAKIQADLIKQQEQLRQRQLERDSEIRKIQESFAQQQLDREAAGLQSGLSATTKRVVPRDFEVGSGDSVEAGAEYDDSGSILDRAIGGAEQGIQDLLGSGDLEFDPQNFIVASPSVNLDDEIGLLGNNGIVTLRFNHLPSFIESVLIDQNIFRDTNSGAPGTPADGSRNNDVDFIVTNMTQTVDVEYSTADSPARLMMTLIDSNGNVYIDQVRIVFGMAARN